MTSEFCEIQKLVELFNPKTDNSDSEDEVGPNRSGSSSTNRKFLYYLLLDTKTLVLQRKK